MFTKGEKVYAEAYKYLRHKSGNIITFSTIGKAEDFDEIEMTLPLRPDIVGRMIFFEGRKIAIAPKDLAYSTIKEHIIKGRYTNDEQIAIILNREKSDEDAALYDKMQGWRDFAADVARMVNESLTNIKDHETDA